MDINEAMKRETSMAGYEGEPPTGDENVEVVQRSGLFGKVLLVERESVESVHMSMRSCASYRSNISKISSAKRGEDEGLDANIAPPQHAPWQNIAAIMVSEVVGAGVLTLSQKYAELGWIIPSIAIIAIFFLVVYTSSMMVEVRKVFPGIVCLSDGADYTYGKWARIAVQTFVILYLVCTLGDYLLLVGKSLGSTAYNVHLCYPIWSLIGAAVLVPIVQLRYLNATTFLCAMNMVSIIVVIALVIAGLATKGRAADVETPLIAEGLDFMQFMQSLSAIFFTFGGQFMFYELMSEMKDFTEFTKTFRIAGPFQVSIYLLVGCVGYYYKGTEASGYFLDNLGFGPLYRTASVLLCFHMMVAFLILGNVLSRMIHVWVSPRYVNDLGWRGKLEWFGCTTSVVVLSFVIANAIPFFEELTSLVGGLLVPSLNLIFPILFYVKTLRMVEKKISWWQWVIYVTLVAFGVLVTVVSTIENFRAIAKNMSTYGKPFSCHCTDIWNTCDCSESRMEFSGFNCTVS